MVRLYPDCKETCFATRCFLFWRPGGTVAKKKTAKKPAAKKSARKPNAAFMKPVTPDAALAAVVGNKPMPRTEITKKLGAYIKTKGREDAKSRRKLNADDAL